MDGGLTITFISVAMFVGTFVLGFIPLLFRLNEVSVCFLKVSLAGRFKLYSNYPIKMTSFLNKLYRH